MANIRNSFSSGFIPLKGIKTNLHMSQMPAACQDYSCMSFQSTCGKGMEMGGKLVKKA